MEVVTIIIVGFSIFLMLALSKEQGEQRNKLAEWGVNRAASIAAAQKWVSPHRLMTQAHVTKSDAQFILREACRRGVLFQAVNGRYYLDYHPARTAEGHQFSQEKEVSPKQKQAEQETKARQIAEEFCRPYALRVTTGGEDLDTVQREAHWNFVEHQNQLVKDLGLRKMVHEYVWTGVRDLINGRLKESIEPAPEALSTAGFEDLKRTFARHELTLRRHSEGKYYLTGQNNHFVQNPLDGSTDFVASDLKWVLERLDNPPALPGAALIAKSVGPPKPSRTAELQRLIQARDIMRQGEEARKRQQAEEVARARHIAEEFCRPYALRVTSGGEHLDTVQREAHWNFVEHQESLVKDYRLRQLVHKYVWTGVRDLVNRPDNEGL